MGEDLESWSRSCFDAIDAMDAMDADAMLMPWLSALALSHLSAGLCLLQLLQR